MRNFAPPDCAGGPRALPLAKAEHRTFAAPGTTLSKSAHGVFGRFSVPVDNIPGIAAFENPLEGILHQLRANIGDAPQAMLNLGCPLNNLIQEMANSDREFQRRVRLVIEAWIDGIEAQVKRGQRSGHVRRSVDAREVAEYVLTLHEGAFSIIKALRDKRVFSSLLTSMETVFAGIAPSQQGARRRGRRPLHLRAERRPLPPRARDSAPEPANPLARSAAGRRGSGEDALAKGRLSQLPGHPEHQQDRQGY